jgi:hypothetical protein
VFMKIFLFFCKTGGQSQGLAHARQALFY